LLKVSFLLFKNFQISVKQSNKIMGERTMNDHFDVAYFKSPIGHIRFSADKIGIKEVEFVDEKVKIIPKQPANELLKKCLKQLQEYFNGERREFDLKLTINGTDFQKKVWKELMKIPFGNVVSYAEIAKRIKNPRAVRAVGQAIGGNKISIIIPCHRVIGSDRKLTGYASGLWRKEWLLKHENALK